MSDFLANLVERTVSPELVVRPKFITPYELMPVTEIAIEQHEQKLEQPLPEESPVVDVTERREASVSPPEVNSEARHEEAPPKSQIEFEVVKPHPTVRNDDDGVPQERPIEVSEQAVIQEKKTSITKSNISKTLSLSPGTLLKLERQSTRTTRIGKELPNINDEGWLSQKDEVRSSTPSTVTIRIGRVEVRATMESSSRGADRRASNRPQSVPRPSLDEYLEQRSKRR